MAKSKKTSIGLGDTIEKITTATGIKAIVDTFSEITGIDCKCEERKEKLNQLFSYSRKVNCLTENDYNLLGNLITKNQLTPDDQKILTDIYYNVFNYRLQLSSCGSCWKGKVEELKKVYEEYKVDAK